MEIDFSGLAAESDDDLFRPDAPILFKTALSGRQIAYGLLALLAVAVGSAVTTSSDISFENLFDLRALIAQIDWIKFVGEAIELLGLVFLLVIFGRKIS